MIGDNGQLFGWSAQTWLWLDQGGILAGNVLMVLSLVGAVVAFVKRESLRRWLRGNRFPEVGEKLASVAKRWDALAFTISQAEVPLWVIRQIEPRSVALLASSASRAAAEQVATFCREQGIGVHGPFLIDDVDDPAESRAQMAHALRRLKQKGHQRLAVDITGGRTPMSVGAFMAAEELGVSTIYVSTRFDEALRHPDMASARICCISSPEGQ